MMQIWKRLTEGWPAINSQTLKADGLAGITNAAIVLPQGVAFALIAGLPPEYGLYTAMIPPIVAALFGSSWHLISGPTTAISLVLFATLSGHFEPGSPEYIEAALALTFLGGIFQLLLGASGLGVFIPLISHSVMVGFTAGAAVLIAGSQIKAALGLNLPRTTPFLEIFQHLDFVSFSSLIVALASLGTILVSPKISKKIPAFLFALLIGSLLGAVLPGSVQTLGELPSVFPSLTLPIPSLEFVGDFGKSAFTIALLGLIEAVAIARAIAIRSGQKLNNQKEIIGQGCSNIVGSFFSSYMGSGSFTRSGVNYEAGAKSPLAAVFAAASLLIILLFISPLIQFLPMPAMAGIIFFVAYRLIDFKEIAHILHRSRTESLVMGITFSFCLLFDLEMAIMGGVLLSLGVFLSQTAKPSVLVRAPLPETPQRKFVTVRDASLNECPQLRFIRIDGPLYFGTIEELEKEISRLTLQSPAHQHLSINLNGNGYIDFFAAEFLSATIQKFRETGGHVYMRVTPSSMRRKLEEFGVIEVLGKENLFISKFDIISSKVPTFDQQICAACPHRIFKECPPSNSSSKNRTMPPIPRKERL